MFDYSKMIKRAIEFFPRWTDIRKRYKTSSGGNLLGAALDETIKIEEAIQDYIDSYFLETYEGHEEDIMAFSYMANIGKVDNIGRLSLKYKDRMLMITTDTRLFNEDKYNEYIYYEDGRLFIKESLYEENVPLTVTIDGESTTEYSLTKYHVWNIFDEFATFVNTRRYENETNKQLLDRILYITGHLPNGSEIGLKSAIISELMFFDPNITMEDIKIERATPENLIKPYEDFESLLEKLMYVNRDVFKCKRWDFDYWLYDFESISYIPHKWDETLSHWQNGIGHGDDLKVIISDAEKTTDAKLTLYNKSVVAFEKFVQNKNIDYNINFKLTKYNNVLNKSNIKYKIKASELADITNEDINLHLYESSIVTETRNAEDLYSFGRGISIIDNSVFNASDINWYKLKFTQKDNQDFKISQAKVIFTNESTGRTEHTQELLKQQTGFIYNAEKELVSSYNQKVINKIKDFNSSNFLIDTDDGITISNDSITGNAIISIKDYSGMYMTADITCDEVDVPRNIIKSKGTYWNDANEFVIRGDYSVEDKIVTIELEANTFHFEVLSSKITGRSTVTLIDNGIEKDPIILETDKTNGRNIFSVERTKEPRKIKVVINTLSFNDVVLGNFKYSNYAVNIETDFGLLEEVEDNKYILPNNKNNNLNISLTAITGKKPIIHKITIGNSIQGIVYTTDYIKSESFCSRKFNIKTTADISLLKIQPINQEIINEVNYIAYSKIISLVYEYFKDDIELFLTKENINLFTTEMISEDVSKNIVLNICMIISESLYSELEITNILTPYIGTIFNNTNKTEDISKIIEDKIESYLQANQRTDLIPTNEAGKYFTIADMFPALNRPFVNLKLIDKIEWYRIGQSLANEIVSNVIDKCTVDLGAFNPRTIYKGSTTATEESYIRLDLSDYENITSITSDGGVPIAIEESGVIYYNIKLGQGSSVSTITITGLKNKETRVVPLLDMITYQIPDFDVTYDKVYCSRLMDSVIVSRTNPGGTPYNSLVKLSSDMLTGIRVTKYELELPGHIGSRYGTHTTNSNDNPVTYQPFDYISFYPAGGIIHEAINEFSSYVEDNRNIPIVNNFAPALNMNLFHVYTIENMNEDEKNKYILRFHSETSKNDDIYSLDSWSIGVNNIAIYNNIDLENDINYTVNTYDINSKEYLSSVIDIKDTYILNNNMILDTTQYIVEAPEGLTIKYEEYNGSQDKVHLLKVEEVIVDSNKFNKLTFSNIDGIYHISKQRYDDKYIKDNIDYKLLGEQGIIIWDKNTVVGTKYYLVYSIKKPVGFLIDIDVLYKAISYDVNAYNKLDTILLSNIKDDEDYSFSKINNIEDVDLIHIDCTNPTFEGVVLNDKRVIRFNKFIEKPSILIKSGYYYINGREYFLYSEDEDEDIVNNQYYGSENIDISGGEILTFMPTNNFLTNTEMRLKGKAGIFNYDCKQKLTYGISNLNSLTACNSFNSWTYFAMNPKLVEGMNGVAMSFTPTLPCSYAYLNITDSLIEDEINYISLLASGDLKIFIGEEEEYKGINFNRALNIKITDEMIHENSETRIFTLIKEPNTQYYLIVQESGILDDIIITTERYYALNGHSKNIDLLGLDLSETKVQGTEYRMSIDDNKDYTPYEAGLMSDGYFKTTSKLDWHITQVANINTEEEFYNCVLENINVAKNYISTGKAEGYIFTSPIYINNQSTIKRLIFKINDIELDRLSGFDIIAYTSNTYNDNYIPIGSFKNNKGIILGESLLQYIKLKITMPPNKVLNNIGVFVEYKSTAENPLKLPLHESGYIESKIYDLQETLDYRLTDLGIEDISNINDIELYVRASRDIEKLEVWHNWERIEISEDLKLIDYLSFYDVRFMQIKILLKTRQSYIKFNHLDVEVI
jgi:hypothetical protein